MAIDNFQAVLRSHGHSECDGVIFAYEYEEGKWIFIADEDRETFTVNLFSGDFHGDPLYTACNERQAIAYYMGWMDCMLKH